ncbi:MAG TPA: asparaginase [Candidatus Marinimicrobia bacterium]|nr:asparaginase [Candidatus Neomarinimicrobiota bacterium]MDP7437127.1 asparaginase [Candidatus Neomarinimicrobiota bacterium]HBN45126.1 L-asparaginase [Candidatus Neomarinimicrobiota bacterium]HJM69598.1 asparaginase [Candidatus Neomarinimicrobiota bacterium]
MGIMCRVMRGDFIESMHVAYAVVVDGDGLIVKNWGDPNYITCIRSSLKPFQASAAVLEGATEAAGFTSEELALMCASHNGEEMHVTTAQGMLEKLGYDISYYECGSHAPYDQNAKFELIRNSNDPTPLHNNCSGKHAGMLCLAKHLGASPFGYTQVDHPVQQAIIKQIKKYSELDDFPLAVDGCSAPVPFMPLYNIALMYQKLASGEHGDMNVLYEAMISHPMLVAGTNRFDTDFILALDGRAVTKVGGEAVRGLGIRKEDGSVLGIGIKMLDGNQRCMPSVAVSILENLELLTSAELKKLDKYSNISLKNHRQIEVGSITIEI